MAGIVERSIRRLVGEGATRIGAFNRWRRPPATMPHPFLTGLHAPVREELTLEGLAVVGTIPPGLDGRYIRNGANPVAGDPRSHHWFLGDGMVHGVRLRGGRALWYRNRYIRSGAVATALGVPPAPGPRASRFDTVNTNIIAHAGATYALVEAGSTPVRFTDDLDAHRYDDFGGTLDGAFTAHPHLDPSTGELHAIAYRATDPETIRHLVVGADGLVRRKLDIPVRDGPSIHDCAITPRYVVILDLPVTFSLPALVAGDSFPFRWNPKHAARVGLLPREGGVADIRWIAVPPAYVFHAANAFEEDDRVVLDVVSYDAMFVGARQGEHQGGHQALRQGPDVLPRGLERWTLDPAALAFTSRMLSPLPQEFPRIDERLTGRRHRFVYALGLPDDLPPELVTATHLLKQDVVAGEVERHDFGPGRTPGEFVFVPRDGAAAEDDGWLVGFVLERDRAELAILDARHFSEPPVARVLIPARVPPGFHGNWLADPARATAAQPQRD